MNNTVICIPSYKNRFKWILSSLKEIDPCYDIIVFLSEGDYTASGYDKYDWDAPNIKYIETPCKSIFEKRQYMLDYVAEKGYKGMFQIDDDLMFYGKRITEQTKRKTSDSYASEKVTFNELLHKVQDTTEEYEAGFGSPMFIFALGFSKPGRVNVNSSINFGQFTYMNVDKVIATGIKYDTSGLIHEDVDFVFELLMHGVKCITLGDYGFQPDGHAMYATSDVSLTCNLMNAVNLRIGMYLKYRDGITLVMNKNGLMTMRCNLKKYWNTTEVPIKEDAYHKGLYEICKTRNCEAVKEYIINHKNKKK